MDPIADTVRLDEDDRFHLGGYLVCLLVDFRHRLERSFRWEGISDTGDQLLVISKDLLELSRPADLLTKLREMELLLERIDDLLTRIKPEKARDFLMPLFANRDVFLHDSDEKLRQFLTFICDKDTLPWRSVRGYVHDARNGTELVAAWVVRLERVISSRDWMAKPDMVEIRRFQETCEMCCGGLGQRALRPSYDKASTALFASYMDTPFHQKAVDLLYKLILERVNLVRSTETRTELMSRLKYLQRVGEKLGGPHVGPLMSLLFEIEPFDIAEELLLRDRLVLALRKRVTDAFGPTSQDTAVPDGH